MKHFSDRLRHARMRRGLTQSELARACGLSQGAISNYESASRKSAKEVFRLAETLQVNATWLATGSGPMEPTPELLGSYVSEPGVTMNLGTYWPFPRISPVDINMLTPSERTLIEDTVLSLLQSFRKQPRRS